MKAESFLAVRIIQLADLRPAFDRLLTRAPIAAPKAFWYWSMKNMLIVEFARKILLTTQAAKLRLANDFRFSPSIS
jgi:hypothetical protein